MKDFFISYTQVDRSWAEWVAWQLEEAGYTTIIQAWDFGPGSSFPVEMHKAAMGSARTIAILSPDYLNSRFAQTEWTARFTEDPTGAERKLLPEICLRKFPLPAAANFSAKSPELRPPPGRLVQSVLRPF